MKNANADSNAFPMVVSESTSEAHLGLSKREYFALHIFAAMVNRSENDASTAVHRADTLLAELEK